MDKEEIQKKIEQYVEGKLSPNQKLAFEKQMTNDSSIQKEVEVMQMTVLAKERLQQEEMLKQFKAWDTKVLKPKNSTAFSWFWIGVLAILCGTLFFYFYKNPKNTLQLPMIQGEKSKSQEEKKQQASPLPTLPEQAKKEEIFINKEEKDKTKSRQYKPDSNRPIAALLSSEQIELLSAEFPLDKTTSVRGSQGTNKDKYPYYIKIEKARKLLLDSKITNAAQLLNQIPIDDIYWPKGQILLGHIFLAQKKCPSAIRAFQNCLIREPYDKQALAGLALTKSCK